jgi:hypothetical protein
MEESLQYIAHQDTRPETDPHCLDRFHYSADQMWRGLENVGEDKIK